MRSLAKLQFVGVLMALIAGAFAPAASASPMPQRQVQRVEIDNPRQKPWPDEAVAAFGRIPVQDRGRVKPLSTFAGFRMLNLNGTRTYRVPVGFGLPTSKDEAGDDHVEKLDPVRWMLDVCLFPEQARHYEIFMVNDKAVLDAIGFSMNGRKRRDRYSFAQLQPHLRNLETQYQIAFAKRDRGEKLDPVESQTIALRNGIIQYDLLESTLATLQTSIGVEPSERLLELFPEGAGNQPLPLGLVLSRWPVVVEWMKAAGPANQAEVLQEFSALEQTINVAWANRAYAVAMIPPVDAEVEAWRNPGELIDHTMGEDVLVGEEEYALLDLLAGIWMARGSVDKATPAIVKAQAALEQAAAARGEFKKASLEHTYYKGDFFYRALLCFVFAFVLAAVSWMTARTSGLNKGLNFGVWALSSVGLVFAVSGVTIRCVLMNRPPVATLYETILFITSVAVLLCLIAEKMTKERIALACAAVFGAAGMFLAMKYELAEAASQGDTMGGLVAVLNTNFWLATHVTSVLLGYGAGLVAALLGHVWIVMRLCRGVASRGEPLDRESASWYRGFARMIYGVICFGLLFSVVGTILGGVWANDSWGRFWGWDPKENGALMIVLFELVILHSRLGGYIKDFGVCVLAVMGGAVVAFSWWHVNQLGVGLHSYGFTAGVLNTLWTYYYFVGAFVLLSGLGYTMFLRPRRKLDPA